MGLMVFLWRIFPARSHRMLIRVFAAVTVACYYWYRIPMLFGFGLYPGDGMLIDLQLVLPAWFPLASRIMTTSLFFIWIVISPLVSERTRCWATRPPIASDLLWNTAQKGNTAQKER